MITNLFAIYDVKAGAYMTPFFLPNAPMAQRVFSDCVNSKDHQFGKNPHDYTLWHLGTFDDVTCQFELLSPKIALNSGNELVAPASHAVPGSDPDDLKPGGTN